MRICFEWGRSEVGRWLRQLGLLIGGILSWDSAQAQNEMSAVAADSANVVLVTIDGLRWQELFEGAEARLLRRDPAHNQLRAQYERPTAEARRQALMPFVWEQLAPQGQVFGNRKLGNRQNLTNRRRISYPGYNELLTGAADDRRIRGNEHIYNPNQTVLELLNRQPGLAGRVAAFATWEAFPYILNQPRSGLLVDAGLHGHERPDSLTYQAARQHLLKNRPRVLYIAFGNTDTHGHAGQYGNYLNTAHHIDKYLRDLWALLQATPQYRGRTTLLISTDHGRGQGRRWRGHGWWFGGAAHTWLLTVGPGVPATGEVRTAGRASHSRIAGLLARSLGVDLPAGRVPEAPAR